MEVETCIKIWVLSNGGDDADSRIELDTLDFPGNLCIRVHRSSLILKGVF